MKLSEVGKADKKTQLERKKRDAQIGLANNAFGAAAGAYGTRAVYREQEAKRMPERAAARAARKTAKPKSPIRTASARVGARIVRRTPSGIRRTARRFAVPGAITAAVGSQLLNAGMDAQSAQYFGRELKEMRDREIHKASDVGHDLVEVDKRTRRFDAEADRQRRIGVYEGAGVAGTLGLGGAAGVTGRNLWRGLKPAEKKAVKGALRRVRPTAGMAGGAAASASLAALAHRQGKKFRNEGAWT